MLLNITPPQRLPIHNNPLPTSRLVHSLGVGIQVGGFRSGSVGSGRRSWRGWVQVGGEGGGSFVFRWGGGGVGGWLCSGGRGRMFRGGAQDGCSDGGISITSLLQHEVIDTKFVCRCTSMIGSYQWYPVSVNVSFRNFSILSRHCCRKPRLKLKMKMDYGNKNINFKLV